MSDATYDDLMEFVVDFRNYYDEYGIEDKLNRQTNRMETSSGVHELVLRAKKISPPTKLKNAAKVMRDMGEEEREKAIETSNNVINLRTQFSRKTAENGGTRGLIADLVDAYNNGDTGSFAEALANMEKFTRAERGEENFGENND